MLEWLVGPVNETNVWDVAVKSCVYGSLVGAFVGSFMSFALFLLYEFIQGKVQSSAYIKRLAHAVRYTIRRLRTDLEYLNAEEFMLSDPNGRQTYFPMPLPHFDNKVVSILEANLPSALMKTESFLDLLGKSSVAFDNYQEYLRLRNGLTEVKHPTKSRLDDYTNFSRHACLGAIQDFERLLEMLDAPKLAKTAYPPGAST